MDFREYVKKAVRTESQFDVITKEHKIKEINNSLFHSIIWIQTEIWEIFEAVFVKWKNKEIDIVNLKEELWDVMWYVAIWCNQLDYYNINFEHQYSWKYDFKDIPDFLYKMNDISIYMLDGVKKSLFYVKPYDLEKLKLQLSDIFDILVWLVNFIWGDLEKICEINIEKLMARYPEKFTTEKAVNRDLKTERHILES